MNTTHEFLFSDLQRDDSHEASCSCGEWGGSFDYREDAQEAWRRHVERAKGEGR